MRPLLPALALLSSLATLAPCAAGADDAALHEAETLADITAPEATMSQILGLMRERLITIIAAAGAPSTEEARKIVDDVLMPDFHAALPALKQQIAAIWAGSLSADDLRATIAFYRTPAGRHLLAATPQITTKSFQVGAMWGQKIARDAVQKHADELRKRGIRV